MCTRVIMLEPHVPGSITYLTEFSLTLTCASLPLLLPVPPSKPVFASALCNMDGDLNSYGRIENMCLEYFHSPSNAMSASVLSDTIARVCIFI